MQCFGPTNVFALKVQKSNRPILWYSFPGKGVSKLAVKITTWYYFGENEETRVFLESGTKEIKCTAFM